MKDLKAVNSNCNLIDLQKEECKHMKNQSDLNEEAKPPCTQPNAEQLITLNPDQRTKLTLQFMYYPEYIAVGHKIVIHDANLQAIGKITKVFFDE